MSSPTPDPTIRPVVLAIQNDPTDPPLMVGEWLEECGIEIRVVMACAGEPVPRAVPAGVHGVMPLGGAPNAHDDHLADWLPDERALLADAVDRGIPVLGLCLGGQLLAAALGGRSELGETTEIGLVYVERTGEGLIDPVISQIGAPSDRIPAAQWHQDHITALPDGAVVLLTNPSCRVQAFRVKDNAYGLQMHPEVDAEAFDTWAVEDDEALLRSGRRMADASAEVRAAEPLLIAAWRPMVRAWGDLVWAYAADAR